MTTTKTTTRRRERARETLTVSTVNVRTGNFESIIKIKWKLLLQFICGAGWKRIKESWIINRYLLRSVRQCLAGQWTGQSTEKKRNLTLLNRYEVKLARDIQNLLKRKGSFQQLYKLDNNWVYLIFYLIMLYNLTQSCSMLYNLISRVFRKQNQQNHCDWQSIMGKRPYRQCFLYLSGVPFDTLWNLWHYWPSIFHT